MSEKLTAKEYAEKLLYTPEYAADKQADVKEKAAAFAPSGPAPQPPVRV